jgi:hypothetical protein
VRVLSLCGRSTRRDLGAGRSWSPTWPACAAARGTVELPLWLYWSGASPVLDLDKPFMRRWLYEIVLREALRPEDLTSYLDRDMLIALWPDLYLPKGVRQAWEEHDPVLRSAAAAVA